MGTRILQLDAEASLRRVRRSVTLKMMPSRAMQGRKIADLLEMIVYVALNTCRTGSWLDLQISMLQRVLGDLHVSSVEAYQPLRRDFKRSLLLCFRSASHNTVLCEPVFAYRILT